MRRALVAIPVLLVSTAAAAAPLPETTGEIRIDVGAGSAIGEVGLSAAYDIGAHAQLEGAVGYGALGLQLSLMPKLVLGNSRDRLVSGVGLTLATPLGGGASDVSSLWLTVDLAGYEHRFGGGTVAFVAAGVSIHVSGSGPLIWTDGDEGDSGTGDALEVIPQVRAGFGWWY